MAPERDSERIVCGSHAGLSETLNKINDKLDVVLDKLGQDYADIKVLQSRVSTIERLVYGAVGVSGGAIILALINLIAGKS
jgi:hypothetical protein